MQPRLIGLQAVIDTAVDQTDILQGAMTKPGPLREMQSRVQAVTGMVVVELVVPSVEEKREEGLEAEPLLLMRGQAEVVVVELIRRRPLLTVIKTLMKKVIDA